MAGSSELTIRPFRDADWAAIWPIFQHVVRAGDTYAYDPVWTPDEARAVWIEPPPGITVVACDGPTVVGTAKAGPNRPGRGAHVSTASFMVDPAQRGRGIGRLLGEHAVEWARGEGYRSMQFNAVVETNTAAVALWKSLGFTVIGTVPEAFQHATLGFVGLHIMYRTL